jgi:hypothetical protein
MPQENPAKGILPFFEVHTQGNHISMVQSGLFRDDQTIQAQPYGIGRFL